MKLHDVFPADRILDHLIDRWAYARDASIYRLIPEAVVRPRDENDVIKLLVYARETKTPVTFRTAGTSLSGQSVTEGILAETVHDWKDYKIQDGGKAIRLQPGIIGERANQILAPLHRRIGPDPASIKAAMIGGIIANNSSGMVCGIQNNSYHTLRHIRFILANGHLYDTARPGDYDRFRQDEDTLTRGLTSLRREILSTPAYLNKIRHKYRLKNTLGYSLNAFIDFEHPLDIFAHLLVGAEGTLAFISNVTLNTIPDPPCKTTGLLIFDSIVQACDSIPFLKQQKSDAVELMDYASLSTAKYLDDPPYDITTMSPSVTGLLCEFQRESQAELRDCASTVKRTLGDFGGSIINGFRTDEAHRFKLWQIRKGLYPTVGSLRQTGTSVITEDICYDVENLAEAVTDLRAIFSRWSYQDAIIFGHAKDGNLHFVVAIDLESQEGVRHYDGMMHDLVDMTVGKFDGALKAEHGTGRNMAPFVRVEWGDHLYEIMWKIKKLADPLNILNPGVLLNRDETLHIQSLKPLPPVSDVIDLCVECGFCEPVCPSRELTLTPRQRIAAARELQGMKINNDPDWKSLVQDYSYRVNDTCAVDGLCENACPVNINTGSFVKDLRFEEHSRRAKQIAGWTVNHFSLVQTVVGVSLGIMHLKTALIGQSLFKWLLSWGNALSGRSLPTWNKYLPVRAPRIPREFMNSAHPVHPNNKTFVYFPSCLNRLLAATDKKESLIQVLMDIADTSGIKLIIPDRIYDICCGTPYSSKGYSAAYKSMLDKTLQLFYEISMKGRLPIIVDTSPCTYQLIHAGNILTGEIKDKWTQMTFIDLIPFLYDIVKTEDKPPIDTKVILHPTCSTQKMEQVKIMESLAKHCARQVVLPDDFGCCGFAGDRGLLIPELTASATRREADNVKDLDNIIRGYSSSRMCEVGMMSATDRCYESIALLVRDYFRQIP